MTTNKKIETVLNIVGDKAVIEVRRLGQQPNERGDVFEIEVVEQGDSYSLRVTKEDDGWMKLVMSSRDLISSIGRAILPRALRPKISDDQAKQIFKNFR